MGYRCYCFCSLYFYSAVLKSVIIRYSTLLDGGKSKWA